MLPKRHLSERLARQIEALHLTRDYSGDEDAARALNPALILPSDRAKQQVVTAFTGFEACHQRNLLMRHVCGCVFTSGPLSYLNSKVACCRCCVCCISSQGWLRECGGCCKTNIWHIFKSSNTA